MLQSLTNQGVGLHRFERLRSSPCRPSVCILQSFEVEAGSWPATLTDCFMFMLMIATPAPEFLPGAAELLAETIRTGFLCKEDVLAGLTAEKGFAANIAVLAEVKAMPNLPINFGIVSALPATRSWALQPEVLVAVRSSICTPFLLFSVQVLAHPSASAVSPVPVYALPVLICPCCLPLQLLAPPRLVKSGFLTQAEVDAGLDKCLAAFPDDLDALKAEIATRASA